MTFEHRPVIEHGTLVLGRQLGQGGQGVVHQVLNKKINETDGNWDVVFKEYSADVLPQLDTAALAARVDLLGELSGSDSRWLCDRTAWPAAVVDRDGHACGFLMRAAPDRFSFAFQSLTGTGPGTQRLANMEYLLNDDSYVAGIGLAISDRDRLALLADLATTLARLHRIGIVVGDLSPKNLLFTTDPEPECFLIDCDAMRLRGSSVLPQVETPDWQVPAGEDTATPASDVHKLALLAVRLFARDQTATDPTALAALGSELGDLARAGLATDAAGRPAASRWIEPLTGASTTASTAPATATLPRPGSGPPAAPPPRGAGTGPLPPRATPAGSTTPNWGTPAKIAAGIAAAVVILIIIIASQDHHDTPSDPASSPQPTDYLAQPTDPVPEDTDTEPAYTDPTSDSPPPSYYGAIAVSSDGTYGRAWDYSSASEADSAAMSSCSRSDCKVLVDFVDGCGAIADNPDTAMYWGGQGATPTEAEDDAISNAGGGHWITYVCTTRDSG